MLPKACSRSQRNSQVQIVHGHRDDFAYRFCPNTSLHISSPADIVGAYYRLLLPLGTYPSLSRSRPLYRLYADNNRRLGKEWDRVASPALTRSQAATTAFTFVLGHRLSVRRPLFALYRSNGSNRVASQPQHLFEKQALPIHLKLRRTPQAWPASSIRSCASTPPRPNKMARS